MKSSLRIRSYGLCAILVPGALLAQSGVALADDDPVLPPTNSLLSYDREEGGVYYFDANGISGRQAVARSAGEPVDASEMPDYELWYGCAPTAAGMMLGYLDRIGLPELIGDETQVAELDSFSSPAPIAEAAIASSGHIAAFFDTYGSTNDPNPTSHTTPNSIADFMGTSRYAQCNALDGETWIWTWSDGTPWTSEDSTTYGTVGCELVSGLSDYVAWRGYEPGRVSSQLIYDSSSAPSGMQLVSFQQFIDAGLPVGILLDGHTVMAYAYSGSTIYINDTDSSGGHTMTWGGSYDGKEHYGTFTFQPAIGDWTELYASVDLQSQEVAALRSYRDDFLAEDAKGRLYTRLLYGSSDAARRILADDLRLRTRLTEILSSNVQGVQEVLAGGRGTIRDADEVIDFLTDYAREAPLRHKVLAFVIKLELRRAQRTGESFLGFDVY